MIPHSVPSHPTDEQLKCLEKRLLTYLSNEMQLISASFGLYKRLREIETESYSSSFSRLAVGG